TCRYRDGFDDLLLKFDRLDVLGGLGDIVPGEVYQLTLEGALTDGQPIRGVDCLMIMLEEDDMDDRDQSVAASVDAMPNPFNPTTRIHYSVSKESYVRLGVYDVRGRLVKELVSRTEPQGNHVVEWDAREAASGIYFCRIQAGKAVQTRKLVLLK
ncbi:MAG: T9SS type A sorting domain-containing protein, partial [Candidatus Latescibacterota bacterium]